MNERPWFLLTNDDGIAAQGIRALASAVAPLGDLLVACPRHPQSSMGRALRTDTHVGIVDEYRWEVDGACLTVDGVEGTPANAVDFALLDLSNRKPALCLSGVNAGPNLGFALTLSGTFGAALHAASFGVPALAVSLETFNGLMDLSPVKRIVRRLVEHVLRERLPAEVSLLNVNIPSGSDATTPVRVTIQSLQNYWEPLPVKRHDRSTGYAVSSVISVDPETFEPDSDIRAYHIDRVVSVTPIGWTMHAKATWRPR